MLKEFTIDLKPFQENVLGQSKRTVRILVAYKISVELIFKKI